MSWTQNYNEVAVLTSKNPEAFLTLRLDPSYSATHWIIPSVVSPVNRDVLYVNGLDINDYDISLGYALKLVSPNNMEATFHIYSPKKYDWEENLYFTTWNTSALSGPGTASPNITIHNRPFIIEEGAVNSYELDNLLVDDIASYMIIRTNPKYTGNITLVVDCSNNIFLDTFKISDILSNKKYRHQQVSANSILSSDIRNVFSTLPLGELYKVDADNTLQIGIPKTELKNQYVTTYNYGARLLKDELYTEDNAILAPLWINSKLPDYFAAFRLNGVYNEETYNDESLADLAYKYLSESTIIKSWNMKSNAPLGKYLDTHLKDNNVQAPVFLSLTDINAIESDPNTWHGIAVDKGVVTGRSEVPYFFNQKSQNFTDLNAFVSQGFERNTLVSSNLINLEYVFNDEDVSLYTMSRYFGLYLTENVLYNIAYYAENPNDNVTILSLDGKDVSVFLNSTVFDVSGNIASTYANRLFVFNDEVQLKRITNSSQIKNNQYTNKPYKNIFSTKVEQIELNPFMLITLNSALEQGEHLRILNTDENKIWEIFGVDVSNYDTLRYVEVTPAEGIHPTVYRTFFNTQGEIADQIKDIAKAFDLFSDYDDAPFKTGVYGDDWVSFILNDGPQITNNWLFQRVTGSIMNDPTVPNDGNPVNGFSLSSKFNEISYFGRLTPDQSYFFRIDASAAYGPIDFEIFGDRQFMTIPFIKPETNYVYSFDSVQSILDKFEDITLYQSSDNWYRRMLNLSAYYSQQWQYVKDPTHISDKVIIITSNPIKTLNSQFNAFSIYPINISLMGINPVKDIDFTVYDKSLGFTSEYFYNRENDPSTYRVQIPIGDYHMFDIRGSYEVELGNGMITQNGNSTWVGEARWGGGSTFNTFDASAYFWAMADTIITYALLDGSYAYTGYKDITEENLSDYYSSTAPTTLLKYGLTVPLTSKWVGLGSDCRNNHMRLMLDSNMLDTSSNFIPSDREYTQEMSYPSFKYLSPGGRSWEDYTFYDINDVIYDADTSTYNSFKDLIFMNPYIDYFSKLVYGNHDIPNTKTRSSICYYNQYKNTIDITILGVNYSIKVENIAKSLIDIKVYNKYRFSFISTSSKNTTSNKPIEIIINENTETILMIWYQGNDELNYNARYSSYLPGKSLLDSSSNGFVTGRTSYDYSFVKAPYYVNNSTIQKTIMKYFSKDATYLSETARPYMQFNKNLAGFNSVFSAWGSNNITGNIFEPETDMQFQTFAQYVNYTYMQNPNTNGSYIMNYGYNYNSNRNWYKTNTTNYTTFKYLISSSLTNIMYYIIQGDKVYKSTDFGTTINPMTLMINEPREYAGMQTYNGWFKPKFSSILDFNSNENLELINIVQKDFILSNTNLRLYNDIEQYWYNKVVSTVTPDDVITGNAISFAKKYNVFKSLWDANYYIKDDAYIDGYYASNELPAFFGSKLPKLPNSILLNKWDNTTSNQVLATSGDIILSYNITRAILDMFKSNSTFLSNWSPFSDTDNVIANYIKDTILTYYNISQSKIEVNYYSKPFDTQILAYQIDSKFVSDNKQNFNGQLAYENDEYIYRVTIPKNGNFSYFVSFTLTEK